MYQTMQVCQGTGKQLYSGFYQVRHDDHDQIIETIPAFAIASNEDEAVGGLVRLAKARRPLSEGYEGHTAAVTLVSEVTIHAQRQPQPKPYFPYSGDFLLLSGS